MSSALVWFRRDLRDFDHAALYHALTTHNRVYCVFVFDTEILQSLNNRQDRRVEFIWESIRELSASLKSRNNDLILVHGIARDEIPKLADRLNVQAVYSNRDYEPSAIARDASVADKLKSMGIAFHQYKDQVIFEQDEILSIAGKPYSVFTPYKNAYLKQLNDFYLKPYPNDLYFKNLAKFSISEFSSSELAISEFRNAENMSLENMGFVRTNLAEMKLPTGMSGGRQLFTDFVERMHRYKEARDYPAVKGPSYLSVHLRFGTVSIRHLARAAREKGGAGAETWLNELIWRDFYFQILHHRPDLSTGKAYKAEYESLPFPNNTALFQAWCEGRTGYPLVDAAMRQLNQTGWMHNRLRMITASFLVKDLLIDWRWGEHYFAEKLIDFDFAANNGGWQWAASTGCDAQPYFRIFNPVAQSEKFDAQGKFIRKYVPELSNCDEKEIHAPWLMPLSRQRTLSIEIGRDYPNIIVEHSTQRQMALDLYKNRSL